MDAFHFNLFAFFSFALGSCIASFLNVCIWRLPREESVVRPPSHCPECGARIKWYQNIPIASWLALRGRCANCRKPISPRYVVVEAIGGVLFLLAYLQWACPAFMHVPPPLGMAPLASPLAVLAYWLVVTGLILGSFIDLDHFYLPDRVTVGGMVLGVPASVLVPELQGETSRLLALYWSLGGLLFGFGFLWGIGWVFTKLFRKEAMGFGDVKLIGAIGAFFGPLPVLFVIILSSVIGSVVGIAMMVRGRAKIGGFTAVPFGPFLALATVAWMHWGVPMLAAYLRTLGVAS